MKSSKGFSVVLLIFIVMLVLLALGFYSKTKGPKVFQEFFTTQNISKTKSPEDICLTNEEYVEPADPKALVLSIPFDLDNYSTKHWGIVPFCANLRGGSTHGGLDFELKPNSKVYSATDGVIDYTQVGKEEGSGEIIYVLVGEYRLGYSGLTNLQVGAGDSIKRGDYIANAVKIPHGEYHVHLGITLNGEQECPLKYMDEKFIEAFKQMFVQADYESQTNARCACECETFTPAWR